MKGILLVLGLAIVLGFAGFYGGGYTCQFIQQSKPGAARRRPLARIIRDAGERGEWALIGAGVGASAGFVLGITIVGVSDRQKKRFADLAKTARSEADQSSEV